MKSYLDKIFIALWIGQEKKVKIRLDVAITKRRFNPYNPLTYIMLAIVFIVAVIMFGVVGCWREIETKGLFKYQ